MSIKIYSADYCPYCRSARALLDRKGVKYDVIDVMSVPNARQEMIDSCCRFTVPQLFVGDKHIGDCTEIHQLDAAGKLDPLLAAD